jgi:hypothetical protein
MKSKTSRLAKKMPATPEQRKAMTFPAVKVSFEHTNDDWALAHLPRVRLATLILQRDDMVLEKLMAGFVKDGLVPEMLEGLCKTKEHLKFLVEFCDVALARSFCVLERLGYDPETELPETKMH